MQVVLAAGAFFVHQPAPGAEPVEAEARGAVSWGWPVAIRCAKH